jgi:hypothetical protein
LIRFVPKCGPWSTAVNRLVIALIAAATLSLA